MVLLLMWMHYMVHMKVMVNYRLVVGKYVTLALQNLKVVVILTQGHHNSSDSDLFRIKI